MDPASNLNEREIDLDQIQNWPPVSMRGIIRLIESLEMNKAPGVDCVLPEIITKNPSWWMPLLAPLFIFINQTGSKNSYYPRRLMMNM